MTMMSQIGIPPRVLMLLTTAAPAEEDEFVEAGVEVGQGRGGLHDLGGDVVVQQGGF